MNTIEDLAQQPRRRSPVWAAAGAVALVVAVLLGYSLLTGPTVAPQEGSPVPRFQLTTFDGEAMILESRPGKVVVVNFFASWCAPCREEASDLEATWRQYRDRDVLFYGIAYKDASSKAQAFLGEFGLTYPSGPDPGGRTARSFGVTGVPETYVVDRQGLLVRHFLGVVTSAELGVALDEALGR